MSRPTNGSQRPLINAVKEVLSNIAKYYGETVEETDTTDKVTYYKMKSFVNETVDKAKTTLNSNGINDVTVLGHGTNVINEYPEAESKINNKDKVFLLTDDTKEIPDIKGYSRSDAEHLLNLLGYKIVINGKGYVTDYIINGDTVTLNLNPKFVESGE